MSATVKKTAKNRSLSGAAAMGPGPGRPKGSTNKITRDLKEMILGALEGAGGVEYLKARAVDTPGPFLTLLGKVLPLQVTGNDGKPLIPPGGITFVIQQQADAENQA